MVKRKRAPVASHGKDTNSIKSSKSTASHDYSPSILNTAQPEARLRNGLIGVDTSKPTAIFKPSKGRQYTVSVAIPGSIIWNAQRHELKTQLVGQIARALAVFCVDEVIIFDDGTNPPRKLREYAEQDADSGYTGFSDPGDFLQHLLAYLETPPYLRQALFQYHPNLSAAGALPSTDMPHHLRVDEWCAYREGVAVAEPKFPVSEVQLPRKGSKDQPSSSSIGEKPAPTMDVDAGIPNKVRAKVALPGPPYHIGSRVTVCFTSSKPPQGQTEAVLEADVVANEAPRQKAGYYWGYKTRRANSLTDVFEEAQWEGGYDFSIGTSERGESLRGFLKRAATSQSAGDDEDERRSNGTNGIQQEDEIPPWRHLLIVFGGVAGLEFAGRHDKKLNARCGGDVSRVFDAFVNLVEGQGSRTIRTEEALWIGLMGLKGFVEDNSRRLQPDV